MFDLEKFLTVLAGLVCDPKSMTPDGIAKGLGIDRSTGRTLIFKDGSFAIDHTQPGHFGIPFSLVCMVGKRTDIYALFQDAQLEENLMKTCNFPNPRHAVSKFKLPGYAIEFDVDKAKGMIAVSDPPRFITAISVHI